MFKHNAGFCENKKKNEKGKKKSHVISFGFRFHIIFWEHLNVFEIKKKERMKYKTSNYGWEWENMMCHIYLKGKRRELCDFFFFLKKKQDNNSMLTTP